MWRVVRRARLSRRLLVLVAVLLLVVYLWLTVTNSNVENNAINARKVEDVTEAAILLLVQPSATSRVSHLLLPILAATRLPYEQYVFDLVHLPSALDLERPHYSLIIVENIHRCSEVVIAALKTYTNRYGTGLVAFVDASYRSSDDDGVQKSGIFETFNDEPISYETVSDVTKIEAVAQSSLYYITNAGKRGISSTFQHPPTFCTTLRSTADTLDDTVVATAGTGLQYTTMLTGRRREVYIASDECMERFFATPMLFLDAVVYATNNRFNIPLERRVQVDIDDVFVGKPGLRLRVADVDALIESQVRLRRYISDFTYMLGFSGKSYQRGFEDEREGDRYLIEKRSNFHWFPHMWDHKKVHLLNATSQLLERMERNRQFALKKDIKLDTNYAIAPHHSGVYPTYTRLYDAWKSVYNISVTSTEQYPSIRPVERRRGFIHSDVSVLPRQTTDLYTHTNFFPDVNGGHSTIIRNAEGGTMFRALLLNDFAVFMTHQTNYANDRLASYLLERAFAFITSVSNLRFAQVKPTELARLYFAKHKSERKPLWRNPCVDKRQMEILPPTIFCDRLPNVLVLGPQKTGSTALHWFLAMHPSVSTSKQTDAYEETQFFSGKHYYDGLEWYTDLFPERKAVVFEKSATYFDNDRAAERSHALLPDAKLIVLIIDPIDRAHSWYQHVKANGDATAVRHTFFEVITAAPGNADVDLLKLQSRCIRPGRYIDHIKRWLRYYKRDQLLLLDGVELRYAPSAAMNQVQKFLGIDPIIDYSTLLRFDEAKGFFCQKEPAKRCLGRGKGRLYETLDPQSRAFLYKLYESSNRQLYDYFRSQNLKTPDWLSVFGSSLSL